MYVLSFSLYVLLKSSQQPYRGWQYYAHLTDATDSDMTSLPNLIYILLRAEVENRFYYSFTFILSWVGSTC